MVKATVDTGAGYAVHATANSGTAAVNDYDDPPPATPVVGIADGNDVTEGGTITFNLSASPAPASALTVNIDVTDSGDFAEDGQDGDRTASIGTDGAGTPASPPRSPGIRRGIPSAACR